MAQGKPCHNSKLMLLAATQRSYSFEAALHLAVMGWAAHRQQHQPQSCR